MILTFVVFVFVQNTVLDFTKGELGTVSESGNHQSRKGGPCEEVQ